MAKKLDGPAFSAAQSLAKALAADDAPKIRLKYNNLQGMLGKNFGAYKAQILALLDDDLIARLIRVTTFEA